MALGPRLDLRQSQSLVMTPQLQQAIKLLALSNLEVEAFIAEEIEKNPLLEAARDEGGDVETLPTDERRSESETLLDQGTNEPEPSLDIDFTAETFHHDSAADGGPGLDGRLGLSGSENSGSAYEDGPDFDKMTAGGMSLRDHLLAQAGTAFAPPMIGIASYLIDHIDDAGYLTVPLLDVSKRMEAPLARVESVLTTLQTFDPTGVAARSLGECLALQAREADRYDPAMARLLANLDLLAEGRLTQLKRMCGVDDEDMGDMIRELRTYDPKPGLRFGAAPVEAVTPDLFVARTVKGWAIEINSATLPRLLVNRSYYAELTSAGQDKSTKNWLNECVASANWLIKALDQRQRTIIKVATEIVKQQEAFFEGGGAHLRPLTLRAVADVIGMHESTVSRVTSNKYLSCARGIFELKYFFTSGIAASNGGDAVSAEAVKSAIRALIAGECGKAILSDDTLVELLQAKGFDIARRTVAKYREALGIGSSVQRRRQKAINAHAG
jgi:RNA polymerase sigma-54 factor